MHYLYRITNEINGKNYIGQSIDPKKRFRQNILESKKEEPSQVISRAIKKHEVENFSFTIIATCLTQDETNYLEKLLISIWGR